MPDFCKVEKLNNLLDEEVCTFIEPPRLVEGYCGA